MWIKLLPQIVELWLTNYGVGTAFIPHSLVYHLYRERAWKVYNCPVWHMISNSNPRERYYNIILILE